MKIYLIYLLGVVLVVDTAYQSIAPVSPFLFDWIISERTENWIRTFLVPMAANLLVHVASHIFLRQKVSWPYLLVSIGICVVGPFLSIYLVVYISCVFGKNC